MRREIAGLGARGKGAVATYMHSPPCSCLAVRSESKSGQAWPASDHTDRITPAVRPTRGRVGDRALRRVIAVATGSRLLGTSHREPWAAQPLVARPLRRCAVVTNPRPSPHSIQLPPAVREAGPASGCATVRGVRGLQAAPRDTPDLRPVRGLLLVTSPHKAYRDRMPLMALREGAFRVDFLSREVARIHVLMGS
jgi:hypothetical protein